MIEKKILRIEDIRELCLSPQLQSKSPLLSSPSLRSEFKYVRKRRRRREKEETKRERKQRTCIGKKADQFFFANQVGASQCLQLFVIKLGFLFQHLDKDEIKTWEQGP